MLLIPRRQIWTQQPQTHTAIAPEYSALAPRLIVNYGGSPNDLVSGKSPVAINRSYAADSKGLGLKGTSGVAQYASRLTGKYLTLVISVTPGVYAGVYQMLFETEVATVARTEGTLMVLPYYDNGAAESGWWSVSLFPSDGVNYTYGTIKFPAPSANIPHTLVVRVDRNLTGPAKVLSVHVDGMAQVLTPSGTNNTQGSNSNFNANNIYINQRAGALFPGAHNVHFVGVFGSLFSSEKAKSLSDNPWQIFKRPDSRIFVPVSVGGGSVNANASGALSAVAVTAPSASASGGASSSGALATITISSPTATASAGGSATASGSFAALSISPSTATATATKSATASGAFAVVSLSAPTATASGTTAGGAVATGAPAQITISHAAAIAVGSAVATGGLQSIGITAPSAIASVGNGNATASGSWAAISITAPTGYASSGFIRAPSGSGPTVIQPGSIRPRQSATSRGGIHH